jgi:hypothetical protein
LFPIHSDTEEADVAYGLLVKLLTAPEYALYYEDMAAILDEGLKVEEMAPVVKANIQNAVGPSRDESPPQFARFFT